MPHAFTRWLATLLVAGPLAACDRPMPLDAPGERRRADPAAPVQPLGREGQGGPPASALTARYLEATDRDRRRKALYDLHDVAPRDGVAALDRLLREETDTDLQVELLDSLAVYDGEVDAKVAILTRALVEQPVHGDAREAALDALLDLQDRRTIPLWQRLADDRSDEVRDLARSTIEELRSAGPGG